MEYFQSLTETHTDTNYQSLMQYLMNVVQETRNRVYYFYQKYQYSPMGWIDFTFFIAKARGTRVYWKLFMLSNSCFTVSPSLSFSKTC